MQRGFLERPDCRIYYEVHGAGPALVFAHGLGGNHMSWWQQVGELAGRYTCVTFSHRGFAPSTAPADGPDPERYAEDLAALLDHLALAEVRIVGQSMGGMTALEYALRRPQSVRALVMAATSGTIERQQSLFPSPDYLTLWSQRAEARAAELNARGIHPAAGERMAREQPAQHLLYRSFDAMSDGLDKQVLRRRMRTAFRRSPEVLRSLRIPTLFIVGDEDAVYPPILSDALAALMPNATLAQVAKAGHSVYFERPAEFNRILDGFLSGIDKS